MRREPARRIGITTNSVELAWTSLSSSTTSDAREGLDRGEAR